MTIYFLMCVFAGFIIGMILMYFFRQRLIEKLAFDLYFMSRSYIDISKTIVNKMKDEQDKTKVNKFLDEVEITARKTKSHIPEKWNNYMELVDRATNRETNGSHTPDR